MSVVGRDSHFDPFGVEDGAEKWPPRPEGGPIELPVFVQWRKAMGAKARLLGSTQGGRPWQLRKAEKWLDHYEVELQTWTNKQFGRTDLQTSGVLMHSQD